MVVEARMTREDKEWVNETAENLYNVVFHEMDAQPFITGMEAGKIATKVEAAFKKAMEQHFK
jgi:hypothetical protein